MQPDELDLISRDEAPILETMRSIYSAIPKHHLAAIHGKIAGAMIVANAVVDALPLIHGPVGCAFQRKLNPFSQAIVESYERYSPKLIMVITTCTTDLIGDDIGSAVEKAKEKVGCDVIYSTGDFVGKSRPVGIQDSLYAMADQMICQEDVARREGSVNLINSPTQRNAKKLQEMAGLLTQMGIEINKICLRLKSASKELQDIKVAVPVGFSLNLLKDIGVDVAALIYRTQTLTHAVTDRAIQEIERANLSLAEIYDYHPELLINPTPQEELKTFKRLQIDLVMAPAKIAHFYNREGLRTVDVNDFTQTKMSVGFLPSLELYKVFREAMGKVRVRSPLLDLMEFDDGTSNLTPHWAKIAMSFHHLRSSKFKQSSYYHFQGLADDVYVVTSADYLAIYAANNIYKGIQRYAGRGGSALGGIIYNVRGSLDDLELVEEFAAKIGSRFTGTIPSDPLIQESELYGQTVIEYAPNSQAADRFRILARSILENGSTVVPKPLSRENPAIMAQKIREENRKKAGISAAA